MSFSFSNFISVFLLGLQGGSAVLKEQFLHKIVFLFLRIPLYRIVQKIALQKDLFSDSMMELRLQVLHILLIL